MNKKRLSKETEGHTQIMKEIEENPTLWGMVQRMVKKAESTASTADQGNSFNCVQPEKDIGTPCMVRQTQNIVTSGATKTKSRSDTTIYRPALRKERVEQSVNSPVNVGISDDMFDKISNYIERVRLEATENQQTEATEEGYNEPQDTPAVVRALDHEFAENNGATTSGRQQSKEISEKLILAAEKNKAMITAPRGNDDNNIETNVPRYPITDPSAIDNQYFISTCHLEESVKQKAYNGKFIELQKLLPTPKRYRKTDEGKFGSIDVIKKDGMKYLVQNEGEEQEGKITNIRKWDEAFRIYAALYAKANPTRSAELMQYMHTIHLANSSYNFDNVLYYDYCFRNEMSDHPERSWGTTNTQMWSLAMRDPLPKKQFAANMTTGRRGDPKEAICWKFNRNKCKRGERCRYEHKCSFCFSTQHSYYSCPKRPRGQKGKSKQTDHATEHDAPPTVAE